MSRLPLLLGESPSRGGDHYWRFPLSGAVGQRLCEWTGIEPEPEGSRYGRYYWALREHFDCLNVFDRYADATPWSIKRAEDEWTKKLLVDRGDDPLVLICLGRRVERAVGFRRARPWGEWFEVGLLQAVTVPHPSGLNRLYNELDERVRTGEVLREAMRRASRSSLVGA